MHRQAWAAAIAWICLWPIASHTQTTDWVFAPQNINTAPSCTYSEPSPGQGEFFCAYIPKFSSSEAPPQLTNLSAVRVKGHVATRLAGAPVYTFYNRTDPVPACVPVHFTGAIDCLTVTPIGTAGSNIVGSDLVRFHWTNNAAWDQLPQAQARVNHSLWPLAGMDCVSGGPDNARCFAIGAFGVGPDNSFLAESIWTGGPNAGWTGSTDQPTGPGVILMAERPNCVSWALGRVDCFARGTDLSMKHIWFDGGSWSKWESLGGNLQSRPSCVSKVLGRIDCFFASGANHGFGQLYFDGRKNPNRVPPGGLRGPGRVPSKPAGVRLAVSGWVRQTPPIAATVSGSPACVGWIDETIQCLLLNGTSLMHAGWDGARWQTRTVKFPTLSAGETATAINKPVAGHRPPPPGGGVTINPAIPSNVSCTAGAVSQMLCVVLAEDHSKNNTRANYWRAAFVVLTP